ncbi:Ubiquitin carboxyl-terminal hydrolase 19 [Linum perenne]
MHVGGIPVDLNWFLQFVFTLFLIAGGLLYVVKNTASRYFEVDASFESAGGTADRNRVVPVTTMESPEDSSSCDNCGKFGTSSTGCQQAHWKSDHKLKCNDLSKRNLSQIRQPNCAKRYSGIALVLDSGTSKRFKRPGKVLFPYEEFVKLYNWDKPGFPPCGLLNCGNSCFANVVLQCLTYTRPLVAYLLEKGHHRECKASQSSQPFSPINILSRLPNIGGNLGYGRQEDAHEFMRFAIDTMQSACLDEFGGEKAVEPAAQETTLVQHIFGGHLQSQVMCTKCSNISNQFENMMDLTVEIHGDATSLEECLDQFTAKEWLQDDNMYKCDSCNDYVKAWKRLTIRRAPNILTIALKRFQSGRFGKLNKRINFPNTLDLSPYMSKGDGTDVYKLYAVVVHVDMLNASFFGHYICYIKDLQGDWFRFDDCKVTNVELDEVLSQGAYMLLYSRVSARPSCLRDITPPEEPQAIRKETDACTTENGDCHTAAELANGPSTSVYVQSESNGDVVNGGSKDVSSFHTSSGLGGVGYFQERSSSADDLEAATAIENVEESNSELCLAGLKQDCTATNGAAEGGACLDSMDSDSAISVAVSNCDLNVSTAMEIMEEQAGDSNSAMVVEDTVDEPKGNINSFSGETLSAKNHCRKRESSLHDSDEDDRNGATRAGATECY